MLRDAVDDLILKTCDVYMYRYMHMYMKVYMYMYTIHIHMHRDAVNDRILNAPHLKNDRILKKLMAHSILTYRVAKTHRIPEVAGHDPQKSQQF